MDFHRIRTRQKLNFRCKCDKKRSFSPKIWRTYRRRSCGTTISRRRRRRHRNGGTSSLSRSGWVISTLTEFRARLWSRTAPPRSKPCRPWVSASSLPFYLANSVTKRIPRSSPSVIHSVVFATTARN